MTLQHTPAIPTIPGFTDQATIERAQAFLEPTSMKLWQRFLEPAGGWRAAARGQGRSPLPVRRNGATIRMFDVDPAELRC